jgi:hypothetical protein
MPSSRGSTPAPTLLPSGRPVPPYKPPGLFARTSGILAASRAAQALSNGDAAGLDDDDDDDDEDDEDDDEEEEDWDDVDDDDVSAAATGADQVYLVSDVHVAFYRCISVLR